MKRNKTENSPNMNIHRQDRKKHSIFFSATGVIYLMLVLPFLFQASAVVNIHAIRIIKNYVIEDAIVNPEGSLVLIQPYINMKCGHLFNKRFLFQKPTRGQATFCILKEAYSARRIQNTENNYERTNNLSNDIENLLIYMDDYYDTFIKMFYFNEFKKSSYDPLKEIFFNFLILLSKKNTDADEIRNDYKLLAYLLLLSEGLDISLEFDVDSTHTVLFLKDADSPTIELSLEIKDLNSLYKKKIHTYLLDLIKSVVNFFIKHRNNPVIERAGFKEACSYEEYTTGKFTNLPGFLIQGYLYHYLGNVSSVKDFIMTVHSILRKYMPSANESDPSLKQKSARAIFEKLFIPLNNLDGTPIKLPVNNRIWKNIELVKNMELISGSVLYSNDFTEEEKAQILLNARTTVLLQVDGSLTQCLIKDYMLFLLKKYQNENNCTLYSFDYNPKVNIRSDDDANIITITAIKYLTTNDEVIDLIIYLLVHTLHNNLSSEHPTMKLLENSLIYSTKHGTKKCSLYFTVVLIIIQFRNKFSDILKKRSSISIPSKYLEMPKCSLSFICVSLAHKNSAHALIYFIKSYLHIKNKFPDYISLSDLILKHMKPNEQECFLNCLTQRGQSIKYIKYIISDEVDVEVENKVNYTNDTKEFLQALNTISRENPNNFQNIFNGLDTLIKTKPNE